jgi:hypothetical protein
LFFYPDLLNLKNIQLESKMCRYCPAYDEKGYIVRIDNVAKLSRRSNEQEEMTDYFIITLRYNASQHDQGSTLVLNR